jgi:hypothetical protein
VNVPGTNTIPIELIAKIGFAGAKQNPPHPLKAGIKRSELYTNHYYLFVF